MPVPDTRVSQQPRSRVGEAFGQYVLVRRLGEGGMGEVYAGRHQRLGREVAIKVLREEFAGNPEIVHRFFQEAKVVNELKHPNTVEIIDFVEEPAAHGAGPRVYLVMELLEGRNLGELDREQGPLRLARIASIFAQACDALEAAHRLGVIHRDIKPDNLFVQTANGKDAVKVLDFGVARRIDGGGKTQVGMVLGTPAYMAPEQAAGRQVDLRADIYSLGISLYEIASHAGVILGPNPAPLTRTGAGEPIPPRLTEFLQSMISLDVERRLASLSELKAVLEAIATQPAREVPTTKEAMAEAGVSGRSSRWPLIAAFLAVPLIALGGWLVFHDQAPTSPGVVPPPTPPTLAEVKPVEPVEPEAERIEPALHEPATAKPHPRLLPKPKPAQASPTVTPPPAPTDPLEPYRDRIAIIRRRFDGLVRRYGAEQLTTLEKAAVSEALAEAAAGDLSALDGSLTSAEHALADAERRLAR